ncbi:hypothetical protein, partial [Pseudomonas sp. HMWF006]|uniref:hypothetical protein n=1 Tax=Pseudomonas sp. HMWF006 TaxID=2056843 RepID=UPI001C455CB8
PDKVPQCTLRQTGSIAEVAQCAGGVVFHNGVMFQRYPFRQRRFESGKALFCSPTVLPARLLTYR